MTQNKKSLELSKSIIERYSTGQVSIDEHLVGALIDFLQRARSPGHSSSVIILECGKLIHRFFEFREVAIAMRDRDGLFRYKVCIGFRDEAEAERMKIAYTEFDLTDQDTFPGVSVSKGTFFQLIENKPFKDGEEGTFNRPSLLGAERKNQNDLIEGDYIDTYIRDANKNPLGWIELSTTRDGKLPSRISIKWIELIAKMIATIMIERELMKS